VRPWKQQGHPGSLDAASGRDLLVTNVSLCWTSLETAAEQELAHASGHLLD